VLRDLDRRQSRARSQSAGRVRD